MILIAVPEFIKNYFLEGSRPTQRTIIQKIKEGVIPGKKIGKYYVDIEAYEKLSGNPLVDRVLRCEVGQLPSKRRK